MKSKKRISKLLVASLLSYGLSQGGFNNFNVVRGMEVPKQQGRDLHNDELFRREKEEEFNRNFTPPDDLEQRLTKGGLDGVTNDMRAAFNRISSRLMEIMAEDNVQADDPRVQELYDARGRWWGPVCVWDWVKNTKTQYTPIVGHKVAGYDEYGENDDNRVNARPLDGARRYCGACGALLNSRFVVSGPNGEELPGNMFAHNKELAPNGLAQGDVQLPCGHIMCVKCSHRIILSKCCENETWGYEKRGKLICPMDRATSDVPNLKTNNIPLGNSYWVSAGKSDLCATSPRTVYGAADPRTLWADRIRYNFIIPEEEQINDRGRFLRLPRERREQIEKERAERGADPDKLERERMANGRGREINMKEAMEANRRRVAEMRKKAQEMREKAEREEREKEEREKEERERVERERVERERVERERVERERVERERVERERVERERVERERVERERKAEEDRLAEEARRAEEARLAEEARKEEEARILAEIERGAREKAEAERREEEARIARERRKEEENARLRTTSSPAPTVSTTNFSAAPSLAAMTALTTLPTMSLSNVATPSISATTPAVQTTTVNATNAPATPVATNNINNAGTPSGNINAVTPSGVNTPTGNQNVATPNGTTSQVTSSHDMKPGSHGLNNDKINNLDINNTEIPVR